MYQNNSFLNTQNQMGTAAVSKTFISRVFSWMAIALAITAFTAYYTANSPALLSRLISETGLSGMGYLVMFAPIGFVLAMSIGFQRFSARTLTLLFGAYSVIMGLSLSFILLIYTGSSIFQTFAVTAGMFGVMAIAGYTTKTDLSKMGSLLFMGLIGIIIASVVNFFLRSSSMDYIISFLGVVIFTGLTAWDVQKLKRIGAGVEFGSEAGNKLAIMGALTLYLDFINLFLFLLRFLGNRK